MRRPLLPSAPAVLAAKTLSACSPEVACPAVGWGSTLDLQFTGDGAAAIDAIVICADAGCTDDSAVGTTDPSAPWVERTGDAWRVSFVMAAPDHIAVRALDSAGAVVAEQDVPLSWVRVGGSEECGGPHEAEASVTV